MVRSLIIITLAIVCGAAAAVGVNRLRNQPQSEAPKIATKKVIVATRQIARGERLSSEMIRVVDWPVMQEDEQFFQEVMSTFFKDVISKEDDAVDRVALTTIMAGEPVFRQKLASQTGEGFIASVLPHGMRAKTIETRGPAASVAGFIRPEDRVDVLLNMRGGAGDNSGGSSTRILLQNVEILAIDQVVAGEVNTVQMLERWAKGEEPTSVTLAVWPEEAQLLDLGEKFGELSLSLRPFGDDDEIKTVPATIKDIPFIQNSESVPEPRRPTYIQTLWGSVANRIALESVRGQD